MYHEMKEEITSKKNKLFKVKKNNLTAKDKKPSLFYFTDFEQVFVNWVIFFVVSFLN